MLDEGAHQLSLWDWSSRPVLSDRESPGSGLGIAWVTVPRLADSGSWLLEGTEATVASGRAVGVRVPPSTGVPTMGIRRACHIHPTVQWSKPACDLLSPLPHSCLQSPHVSPRGRLRMSQWVTDTTALLVGQGLGWGLATSPGPPSLAPSWAAQVPAPKAEFVVESKPLRESLGTYIKIPFVMT